MLDVGYGEGDMLRRIHRWGARAGVRLELAGVDLDPASAPAARAATPPDWGIDYRTGDVFDQPAGGQDVIVSSLFTHHLTDAQVVDFLRVDGGGRGARLVRQRPAPARPGVRRLPAAVRRGRMAPDGAA